MPHEDVESLLKRSRELLDEFDVESHPMVRRYDNKYLF
jgi:hypothetical protein